MLNRPYWLPDVDAADFQVQRIYDGGNQPI